MSLPFIIGNQTSNIPGSDFDANNNALGVMATTACTATGTNTIALSPLANQPAVSVYANYQQFSFVAPATSTGAVNINVSAIGALPLYLPDGVTQATTNNIFIGVFYVVAFNLALNSGSGGFVIVNNTKTNVTAGSYTNSNLTVGPDGRVTAASNGAATSTVAFNSIAGCLLSSITGTSTTASIQVSSGQATNSANTAYITSAGYTWAASNGNAINGTDAASSTLANSTTYHMFLCSGGSGTGTFVSASLTPTFPTGYTTSNRRIGSFNTTVSGTPIPYTSRLIFGGATINWLATQVLDINTSSLSTSRTLFTMSVPTGLQFQILGRSNTNSANYVLLTSPDETDVAPTTNDNYSAAAPGYDVSRAGASVSTSLQPILMTNTSGQIGARANAASTLLVFVTRGWIDFRVS